MGGADLVWAILAKYRFLGNVHGLVIYSTSTGCTKIFGQEVLGMEGATKHERRIKIEFIELF